jgi:hypothetical protein
MWVYDLLESFAFWLWVHYISQSGKQAMAVFVRGGHSVFTRMIVGATRMAASVPKSVRELHGVH